MITAAPLSENDLQHLDLQIVKKAAQLRDIHMKGVDENSFEYAFDEVMTITSLDGRLNIPLVPQGETRAVTFSTRHQYSDLMLKYRASEMKKQVEAIRRGLSTIIPISLISLFAWHEVEAMVCGSPKVDLTLLKRNVRYGGISCDDPRVAMLWRVLEEFTDEERRQFLRFVWGRSRLPLNDAGFGNLRRFKISNGGDSTRLPAAHTCFFEIELPAYVSDEQMRNKLLWAISEESFQFS
jgi:hypothetical protein